MNFSTFFKNNQAISVEKTPDGYIAMKNNIEIGKATVTFNEKRVVINTLYVIPQERKAGVASRLITAVESNNPGKIIQVTPIPYKKEAKLTTEKLISFYERKGFTKVGNVMLKKSPIKEDTSVAGGALGGSAAVGHSIQSDWYAPGDARMPKIIGKKKRIQKRLGK